MTELTFLIYASKVTPGFQDSIEINKILTTSRKNNKSKQVTGMLLCNLHYFLQAIEGPKTVLNELYETIAQDNRHQNVVKISETIVHNRQFSEWQMGFYLFPEQDIDALPRDWTQLDMAQAQLIFSKALSSCKGDSKTYYSL